MGNKNAAKDALLRKLSDLLVAEFGSIEVHLTDRSQVPVVQVIFLDFEDWRRKNDNPFNNLQM